MHMNFEDLIGAINPAAYRRLKSGKPVTPGTVFKNPKAARQVLKHLRGQKTKEAGAKSAVLRALLHHETQANINAQEHPTTLVAAIFDGVGAATLSDTATMKAPYSGKRWRIVQIEAFSPDLDDWRVVTFSPGGVNIVDATTNGITYAATNPVRGVPVGTFSILATQRFNPKSWFGPWARKGQAFGPADTIPLRCYNAGASSSNLVILFKMISSPCDESQKYKMNKVGRSFFLGAYKSLVRTH
jgi:hypothetical protein